ncbi:MAG: hypothetical protein ACRD44_15705, partial [Bryobacteraceae bacterium]
APMLEPARTFEVAQLRSIGAAIRLEPGERVFILSVFVPHRPQFKYRAEIRGPGSTPVLPTRELSAFDASGNTSIVCESRAFPAGVYTITITEHPERTVAITQTFEYRFTVER